MSRKKGCRACGKNRKKYSRYCGACLKTAPDREEELKQIQKRKENDRVAKQKEACDSCGSQFGIVPETGMCAPCSFGDADSLIDYL